ncbi:uncharacterized protein LOC114307945 [Camellia sinensis]|uniref:uncharacterized protein LOC114307945 n=1 Tax=Camellia sinensis TaxID=4442 RepID=UPI001036DCDC|nr:uncharacterized protein LOC114307945 [Camellia sinensis]
MKEVKSDNDHIADQTDDHLDDQVDDQIEDLNEPRRSKRAKTTKSFDPDFLTYMLEGESRTFHEAFFFFFWEIATAFTEIPGSTVVPFTAMQAAVSKNMLESLSVPTFRVGYPVTTDALDALYEKVKPNGVTMTLSMLVVEFWIWTFTLSNLGMFGVDRFDAILPLGQGAIMAARASKPTAIIGEVNIN